VEELNLRLKFFLMVQVENHWTSGGELEFKGLVPHGVEKV